MEVRELLWIWKKHWKSLLVFPLICAAIGAYMHVRFTIPTYQASEKILIKRGESFKQTEIITRGGTTKKDAVLGPQGQVKNEDSLRSDETIRREEQKQLGFVMEDVTFGAQVGPTYAEIAKTHEVMDAVKQQLNTAENGNVRIQLTHITNTQILQLKVVGTNPDQVFKACDVFTQTFSDTIKRISGGANLEVIEAAKMPAYPLKTDNKKPVVGGFLLGLLLAAGSAIIIENVRNTIKVEKDIYNKAGIAAFGSIPNYGKGRKEVIEQPIVMREPDSFAAESFREIRTVVDSLLLEEKNKTLLLTSVKKKQGTSSIAANLACALVKEGKKVLLVDCNLRRPSLYKMFGVDNDRGLAEMFTKNKSYQEYVKSIPQGPDFISTGANSSGKTDIWGTEEMKAAVGRMQDHYDYVLLDTPPVNMYSDALSLSSYANMVLLIIKQDSVSYTLLEEGIYKLKQVSANAAGAILNRTDKKDITKKYPSL